MHGLITLKGDNLMTSLKVYSLAEFNKLPIPPKMFIVDPFLPAAGLIEIYSRTGVGKTTFAMALGMAVALGQPFMKWNVPSAKKVLYVDGEMSPADMQNRASAAAQYFGIDVSLVHNFKIINRDVNNGILPEIGDVSGQNAFDEVMEDADLIILDNLSTLRFNGKENEADSWSVLQNWLLRMRGRGKSVIILHHAGKDGSSRGTSRRHDALDTVIKLDRPHSYTQSDGAVFEVHFEKTRGFCGDAAEPVGLSHAIIDGISCWEQFIVGQEKLLQVVDLLNQNMRQKDIASMLNISQGEVSKRKAAAVSMGLIG